MGKLKIPPITDDHKHLITTIVEMMEVTPNKAFDIAVLMDAMTMLPFMTSINYDKIFGRWIFTNQDYSDWPKFEAEYTYSAYGANFTFVADSPEQAMIRGIHYYYHTRIKR